MFETSNDDEKEIRKEERAECVRYRVVVIESDKG